MYTIFLVAIDFRIFRRRLQGSKPIGLKSSLYHWKTIETQMFKMGLHDPFIMAKRKAGSEGGVRHTIGKILTKATTLLYTSFQSEVYTQSYGAPKLRESQLWEFQDSHLGIPRQNVIWMWASWKGTKYTIRGKVLASPKSRPW